MWPVRRRRLVVRTLGIPLDRRSIRSLRSTSTRRPPPRPKRPSPSPTPRTWRSDAAARCVVDFATWNVASKPDRCRRPSFPFEPESHPGSVPMDSLSRDPSDPRDRRRCIGCERGRDEGGSFFSKVVWVGAQARSAMRVAADARRLRRWIDTTSSVEEVVGDVASTCESHRGDPQDLGEARCWQTTSRGPVVVDVHRRVRPRQGFRSIFRYDVDVHAADEASGTRSPSRTTTSPILSTSSLPSFPTSSLPLASAVPPRVRFLPSSSHSWTHLQRSNGRVRPSHCASFGVYHPPSFVAMDVWITCNLRLCPWTDVEGELTDPTTEDSDPHDPCLSHAHEKNNGPCGPWRSREVPSSRCPLRRPRTRPLRVMVSLPRSHRPSSPTSAALEPLPAEDTFLCATRPVPFASPLLPLPFFFRSLHPSRPFEPAPASSWGWDGQRRSSNHQFATSWWSKVRTRARFTSPWELPGRIWKREDRTEEKRKDVEGWRRRRVSEKGGNDTVRERRTWRTKDVVQGRGDGVGEVGIVAWTWKRRRLGGRVGWDGEHID